MPDIPAGVVGFLVVVVVVAVVVVVVVVVDVDVVVVLGITVCLAGCGGHWVAGTDVAFAGTGFVALAGVDLRGFTILGVAVVVVGFGVAGGAAVWGAGVCWGCGFRGGLLASSLRTCSTQTRHAPAEQDEATPGTHLHTQMCWHSSDRHFDDQNSTINKHSHPLLQKN